MNQRYVRYPDLFHLIPRIRWGRLPFSTVTIRIIAVSWWGWTIARHRFSGDPFFYPEEHQLDVPEPSLTGYTEERYVAYIPKRTP